MLLGGIETNTGSGAREVVMLCFDHSAGCCSFFSCAAVSLLYFQLWPALLSPLSVPLGLPLYVNLPVISPLLPSSPLSPLPTLPSQSSFIICFLIFLVQAFTVCMSFG